MALVAAGLKDPQHGWSRSTVPPMVDSALGEFGVVFLLFTLGPEFSLPRMIAMRHEVFAVGGAQLVLDVPMSRVVKTVGDIRRHRYSLLRSVFRSDKAGLIDASHSLREELHTVVVPPGAWAVSRSIAEARQRGAEVSFSAVRRDGIVGRDPEMKLRAGDVVVLYGTPEALEHAEAVLLTG